MNEKQKTSLRRWPCRCAAGLTLVEVLAATALLGTLLAAALIARGRFLAAGRRVAQARKAWQIADELLASWWPQRMKIQPNATGDVPGHAGWRWRTRGLDRDDAKALGGRTVALEIFCPDSYGDGDGRAGGADKPAASLEFLLPGRETGEGSP